MQATDFETVLPEGPLAALPTTLNQTPSRAAPFLLLALAAPAALASLAPISLILVHASHDTSVLAERSGSVAAVLLALLAWIAVFAWPIAARAARAGRNRIITISADTIEVTDTAWLSTDSFCEPIAAYTGLAHRVRSSLSGTRHELILVHPDPARTVLLRIAAKITQAEVDETARLLACREIAPRISYPTFGLRPVSREPRLASAA